MRHLRQPAYTLVELMVVLLIIIVLVLSLLPVMSKAREKARQSTCINNQRQLNIAMTTYSQDGIDIFPGDPSDTSGKIWRTAMGDSLGNPGIFHCPSIKLDGSFAFPNYGMNATLCGVATGAVKLTSTALLTADAKHNMLISSADADILRHETGFIASFVDGHEQFITAATPVIWGEGDQGTLYCFGAINTPVTFTDDGAATCPEGGVIDGGTVLLVNSKNAPITAHVTVTGGTHPPATGGLDPSTAKLDIAVGMGKAFSLNCWTDDSGQIVDTTYKFGDDPTSVSLLVSKPQPPTIY